MSTGFGDCFDYCCGEHPPLTATDFPMSAAGGVEAPSPTASTPGGSPESNQRTLCELVTAIDELNRENASLRSDLAAARQAHDTAQAQLSNYTRTGW